MTYKEGLILYSAQRNHTVSSKYTRIGTFRIFYEGFFENCPIEHVYII